VLALAQRARAVKYDGFLKHRARQVQRLVMPHGARDSTASQLCLRSSYQPSARNSRLLVRLLQLRQGCLYGFIESLLRAGKCHKAECDKKFMKLASHGRQHGASVRLRGVPAQHEASFRSVEEFHGGRIGSVHVLVVAIIQKSGEFSKKLTSFGCLVRESLMCSEELFSAYVELSAALLILVCGMSHRLKVLVNEPLLVCG
jgi:hypothetical protein